MMITEKISSILKPILDETLDDYLFRVTGQSEIRNKMLEVVEQELLLQENTEETKNQLEYMKDILEGAGTKYFYGPSSLEGIGDTWFEKVLSRPAVYKKPSYLD